MTLRLAAGGYSVDRGSESLALLVGLEVADGDRSSTWSGHVTLDDGTSVADFAYGAPAEVTWLETWWETVTLSRGTTYRVTLTEPGGRHATASVVAPGNGGLDTPNPTLGADGGALEWPAVQGAAAYRCRFTSAAGDAREASVTSPTCSVAGLGAGSWSAVVSALSVDTHALTADSPAPPAFDLTSQAIGLALGPTPVRLTASIGAVAYGGTGHGLAVAATLLSNSGGVMTSTWNLTVTGPGLSPSSPLKMTIEAGTSRQVAWTYDVEPSAGTYQVIATSGSASASATASFQDANDLPQPASIVASPKGNGGAEVTWGSVPGATSFLVTIWNHQTGALAASEWAGAPPVRFSNGAAPAGAAYDVYVAATNVAVSATSPLPAHVSVSENTYQPAVLTP